MPLTADDARAVADEFLEAAKAIDAYLDEHFGAMSRAEYETISESAKTLLRVSSFMTTTAVGLAIDEMQDESAELTAVIGDAREKLSQLQAIGKVIRVTAGLADLATAIIARDPRASFNAVKGLRENLSGA